jgi:phage shock protein C
MQDLSGRRRLVRLPEHGTLGGVCAGIADYLDADVTLVRFVWVILSIVPGSIIGGIIAYFSALVIMPVSSTPGTAPRARVMRSRVDRKIAGVCGGLAEYLVIDSTVVRLVWAVLSIVPGCIVLGVAAYIVAWFIVPERPSTTVPAATPATGPAI